MNDQPQSIGRNLVLSSGLHQSMERSLAWLAAATAANARAPRTAFGLTQRLPIVRRMLPVLLLPTLASTHINQSMAAGAINCAAAIRQGGAL